MREGRAAAVPLRDRVRLTGIAGFGHHGVFPEERQQGQPFLVDVTCALDLADAAEHDDLARTLDYGRLAKAVVADIERDPVDLIETLADRIATTCLAQSGVHTVEVTVHKPQAPMPVPVADVAVTLLRRKQS